MYMQPCPAHALNYRTKIENDDLKMNVVSLCIDTLVICMKIS